MHPRPLPEPFARPFAVRDALDAGISAERLRRRDLATPFRGARTLAGTESEFVALCRAALASAGPGSAISHSSAARLHGIRLPGRLERNRSVHVSVAAPRRAVRIQGIIGHKLQLERSDLQLLDGVVVTSPARTWCDLTALMTDEDLLAAGDSVIWRRRPLSTHEHLAAALERYPGRRGKPALLRTLPELSPRSDSRPETIIRSRILAAGLPRPSVNPRLFDRHGRFLAMPDLAFLEFRELVEYEGEHHRTDAAQWRSDLRRVPRLEDEDWHTTRLGGADLDDSREFLARLDRRLRQRG